MRQFLGFGNGEDGDATLSGTDAPIDSSCSGSSGSTSLSATNGSFTANQMILIHQTRGTGAGNWEINKIASYSAGTITTVLPLVNTYTDSGASQAQVLVIPQYSSVTISSTYTAKNWNGETGGILSFACSGRVNISGTLTTSEKGFRGAGGGSSQQQTGRQGEGTSGAGGTRSTAANGNGAGGGEGGVGDNTRPAGAGGGGGHGDSGTSGTGTNGGTGGTGGSSFGPADLTTMAFGGAGGEGGTRDNTSTNNAVEGYGGGIIFLPVNEIIVTGAITANGQAAVIGDSPYGEGGGAGGSILVKTRAATLGSSLITATGGAGANNGGAGAVGRIRIEACSITGTTNPSASKQEGGQSYCRSAGAIL